MTPLWGQKQLSNCPLAYGWMCTQNVVETVQSLVMSGLNSVHAMEGALSMCPSSDLLKSPVGLTWSQSASSQLHTPISEQNSSFAQDCMAQP